MGTDAPWQAALGDLRGETSSHASTTSQPAEQARRIAAERGFWDDHLPGLTEATWRFEAGPEPNTAHAIEALEPLEGCTVLDFACGAGVTSAWLAQRGAQVVGIDI